MKDPLEDAGRGVTRRVAGLALLGVVFGMVLLAAFAPGTRAALAIVVGIILMIVIHEAGHFLAAKWAGMKASEFFVGFGPRLWSFRRGETEYGVKAILAGGYVRILGMHNLEEVDPADEARTFRSAPFGKRLVVILAGVTANLLVAVLLFYAVSVGNGVNELSTQLRAIVAGSAAADAGFQPGDRIVAVDGARIHGWETLKARIESHAGEPIEITLVRDGERMTLEATPGSREGKGFLGVSPSVRTRDVGVVAGVGEAFSQVGSVVGQTADGVVRWFSPSGVAENAQRVVEAPKAGSQADIERPRSIIGIVDIGSQLHSGWDVLYLLALFNVAIAFFNLLPLLPLDGGHAVVVLYEWAATKITKRRVQVDYRKLMPAAVVVLAFLMFFAATIMFQDVRDIANR